MTTKIRYVLMLVFNPTLDTTVGITKKKGPRFLLNRICFPGGKIEEGESPETAASRELLEEVALELNPQDWVSLRQVIADDYELYVFGAIHPNVHYARQCEQEPVWHLDVKFHLNCARRQPEQYAPDFLSDLALAFQRLPCSQRLAA